LTDDQVGEIVRKGDVNCDGRINYQEFVEVIAFRSFTRRCEQLIELQLTFLEDGFEVMLFRYLFARPSPAFIKRK
jgi:hypothetical protein